MFKNFLRIIGLALANSIECGSEERKHLNMEHKETLKQLLLCLQKRFEQEDSIPLTISELKIGKELAICPNSVSKAFYLNKKEIMELIMELTGQEDNRSKKNRIISRMPNHRHTEHQSTLNEFSLPWRSLDLQTFIEQDLLPHAIRQQSTSRARSIDERIEQKLNICQMNGSVCFIGNRKATMELIQEADQLLIVLKINQIPIEIRTKVLGFLTNETVKADKVNELKLKVLEWSCVRYGDGIHKSDEGFLEDLRQFLEDLRSTISDEDFRKYLNFLDTVKINGA